MKNFLLIIVFLLLVSSKGIGQLNKIKISPNKFEIGDTTIIYGYSLEEEFVLVALDTNFNELKSITIPKQGNKTDILFSHINYILGFIYIEFYNVTNESIIRVKISNDFNSYDVYEINAMKYKNRLLSILKNNKSNPYFITEDFLPQYLCRSTNNNLYLIFQKTSLYNLNSNTYSGRDTEEAKLFTYDGATTLVKYSISEEFFDGFLYFNFEKIWEHILDDGTEILGYDILNLDEDSKQITILEKSKNNQNLIALNTNSPKIVKEVEFNKSNSPQILFEKKMIYNQNIFIIENQGIYLLINLLKNDGLLLHLFDKNLNIVNDPIEIPNVINKSQLNSNSHNFMDLNRHLSYYSSGNTFYINARIFGRLVQILVDNKTIKYKVLNADYLNKIDPKYDFSSPNFIANEGQFILVGTKIPKYKLNQSIDKIKFLNLENNITKNYLINSTIIKDDYYFPGINAFQVLLDESAAYSEIRGINLNEINVSKFFQSPTGNQLLWFLLEEQNANSKPAKYSLKVEQL